MHWCKEAYKDQATPSLFAVNIPWALATSSNSNTTRPKRKTVVIIQWLKKQTTTRHALKGYRDVWGWNMCRKISDSRTGLGGGPLAMDRRDTRLQSVGPFWMLGPTTLAAGWCILSQSGTNADRGPSGA